MSKTSRRRAAQVAAVALTGAAASAAAPAAADAASFRNCNASILSGSLVGQQLPPVAGVGGTGECRTATGGAGQVLPAPLEAAVLSTGTNVVPGQVAGSSARIADLGVGIPGGVLEQITAAVRGPLTQATAQVDNNPLTATLNSGLSAIALRPVRIDVTSAVNALLTLPSARNLLSAQAVESVATATCVNGSPVLGSSSRLVGLRALGGTVDVNPGAEQALNVLDAQAIDLSNLDLSLIQIRDANGNAVPLTAQLTAALQGAIRPILDAVPTISIPAQVLRLKVTAGEEQKSATDVTRTALRVELGLLGQSVADLRVARTVAGIDGNPCGTAPVSAGEQALQCSGRRISLTDASIRGGVVRYRGFVDQNYAARFSNRVRIKGTWFGRSPRTVTTRTARSGRFSGSFRVSSLIRQRFRQRRDNDIRAYATVGRARSQETLKLARRLNTNSVRQLSNGRVRFTGRATSPRSGSLQRVEIRQRLGCSKTERVVARGRLTRNGSFSVTTGSRPSGDFGFYRAVTRVIATDKRTGRPNGKLARTFTVLNPVTFRSAN